VFLHRPGNQLQFSAGLGSRTPARGSLREIQQFARANLTADLSVPALAARAGLSPRHFARSFRAETGTTPARYIERLRLEAARLRLEEGDEPIATTARACGFGTSETMRRTFVRALGVSPAEYRRRFRAAANQNESPPVALAHA
jgi:transcriptional regulator GlxA family with amidase domain